MSDSTANSKPAMTPQQAAFASGEKSALALYKEYAVGSDAGWLAFLGYEAAALFLSNLPGLPGFALRSIFYPSLFRSCGRRPAIGRGVVIRNPGKMTIGRKALIDDYTVLDVRGDASIELADYVSVGRFTTIAAKGGKIKINNAANIGSYCRIATNSSIEIGDSALIAAYCYIGPGNHQRSADIPLIASEMEIKDGVRIGAHAWIGAGTTILDGVKIGEGAVIGANSLVTQDVPSGATAVGSPARILKS